MELGLLPLLKRLMKQLNLSLLLTTWIAGAGITAVFLLLNAPVTARQVAQLTSSPSSRSTGSLSETAYSRFMQAGYEATTKKNYAAAKEQFEKALVEKPKDIYAQQAIHNVNAYLARRTNSSANTWGLILGATALLTGLGAAFWLFFRTFSPPRIDDFKASKADPAPAIAETADPSLEQTPLFHRPEEREDEFPIQPTTRLANPELLDSLLLDLRDSSPQKRRKAIWKLAQKADSRAMQPLVDLMIETDSQERTLILEALSQISTRTLKPMNQALAISLQDQNPQVRKNAIRDLTRIYDIMSQIGQMLSYALEDSDGEVKETAKWALSQLNLQAPSHLGRNFSTPPRGAVVLEQSYSESADRE